MRMNACVGGAVRVIVNVGVFIHVTKVALLYESDIWATKSDCDPRMGTFEKMMANWRIAP